MFNIMNAKVILIVCYMLKSFQELMVERFDHFRSPSRLSEVCQGHHIPSRGIHVKLMAPVAISNSFKVVADNLNACLKQIMPISTMFLGCGNHIASQSL